MIEGAQETLTEADLEETLGQEKCIKQFVLNVEKNAKSHSNLTPANLFTVQSAGKAESHQYKVSTAFSGNPALSRYE